MYDNAQAWLTNFMRLFNEQKDFYSYFIFYLRLLIIRV
ncbi:hypothetical protein PCARR_a1011 [Pseudoalteromonas carrageenovora IAM 12662]|uniref:Uncharacterized protein n=1 Tax=Pseudoalteromonas carrageenovora IAM 12662 TaxID=1314868 RepID=A0ABR9EQ28_PSEVC|nr:hypothetical protein [Pseudoalteromonas carrageenovora IAM 12662]